MAADARPAAAEPPRDRRARGEREVRLRLVDGHGPAELSEGPVVGVGVRREHGRAAPGRPPGTTRRAGVGPLAPQEEVVRRVVTEPEAVVVRCHPFLGPGEPALAPPLVGGLRGDHGGLLLLGVLGRLELQPEAPAVRAQHLLAGRDRRVLVPEAGEDRGPLLGDDGPGLARGVPTRRGVRQAALKSIWPR